MVCSDLSGTWNRFARRNSRTCGGNDQGSRRALVGMRRGLGNRSKIAAARERKTIAAVACLSSASFPAAHSAIFSKKTVFETSGSGEVMRSEEHTSELQS